MSESADGLLMLQRLPFAVSSLASVLEQGSHERELTERVCQSIRRDVEYIAAQWRAERERAKQWPSSR
jgi:hypothetical protein